MAKKTSKEKKYNKKSMRLNYVDLQEGEKTPDLFVKATDSASQTIHISRVDDKGYFDIPGNVISKAERIIISPILNREDEEPTESENAITYRKSQFIELARAGTINIAKPIWESWYAIFRCVTGRVRLCRRHPFWYFDLLEAVKKPIIDSERLNITGTETSIGIADSIRRQRIPDSLSELIFGWYRCKKVCSGTVEVYRRTCCCRPWIIDDVRLPDLILDLEEIVRKLPDIPRIPDLPDPPPEVRDAFLKDGTLDELTINAPRDLQAIKSLKRAELAEYINARPYLICRRYSCSTPKKVGQGFINPDGRFNICWVDLPSIRFINCHDEYAYIVKQRKNGITYTIYNGVATNKWYHLNDDVTLTSYSWFAFACRDNGGKGEGAFVYLDIIGDTESWNLETPNATGWDRVANPAYNSGLVFPAANPSAAQGANLNRNWGGTLKLNYKISEDMKDIGARYYRISVTEADSNGNPTGTRHYLNSGLAWEKAVIVGTDIEIQSEVLGPDTVGGNNYLYKIPYDADEEWSAGQYHGFLNTTDSRWIDPTKRHLVTIEIFDANGTRLRPNGTPATGEPGNEVEAAFTFRRRYQNTGPTSNVPYGALTHMFWWDNRNLSAKIEYLNKQGVESTGECQFLTGTESTTFGVGYRAYHPNEMFQLRHRITWKRGLGPATGTLQGNQSNNVGKPPASPGNSQTNTFHQMLHSNPTDPTKPPHSLKKCAFTAFLTIYSKMTDGDYLGNTGITETAAFALEINSGASIITQEISSAQEITLSEIKPEQVKIRPKK